MPLSIACCIDFYLHDFEPFQRVHSVLGMKFDFKTIQKDKSKEEKVNDI